MSDDLLPWLSGPGAIVLWSAGKWVTGRFVRKADSAEDKAAELAAKQLQEVAETTRRVERSVDQLTHAMQSQGNGLVVVTGRVEGISKDYGGRLHAIEETQARHDERIKVVERKGRR